MRVTLSGTRGSLAAAGPDTVRYGGDTASVLVTTNGFFLALDAGSGIRRLGPMANGRNRVDILLSHLHMDHIQGLGFFDPVFDPNVEVHIWGPGSVRLDLEQLLGRYLSPPLFPVRIRELAAVVLHDVQPGSFQVGPFLVTADYVSHPGATLGYRLEHDGRVLSYLPDHEPALGAHEFPADPDWTSGHDLMLDANLLIHDAQYTDAEYEQRQGWGHSTFDHTLAIAEQCRVERLVTFHHDPSHDDDMLDSIAAEITGRSLPFDFVPGRAGTAFDV